ncbi:hypothetical protein IMSAG025_00162 [Muribaculaceae bacterium]|nr:hypothetical protein IMSAG025_00162 [Muribaculaceae bacterium]
MYIVLHLLGDHCQMRRFVKLVSSASVFMRVVVFHRKTRILSCAKKRPCSESLCLQLGNFGKAVAVVVISVTITALSVNKNTRLVIVGDNRSIQGRIVVKRA